MFLNGRSYELGFHLDNDEAELLGHEEGRLMSASAHENRYDRHVGVGLLKQYALMEYLIKLGRRGVDPLADALDFN
jgi:hypothetical protein